MHPPPRSTLFPYTTLFRSCPSACTCPSVFSSCSVCLPVRARTCARRGFPEPSETMGNPGWRSEEHTSELQSRRDLVCRLLLEKKKKRYFTTLKHCITSSSK